MDNNDKIISIKRIKLNIMKRLKRNTEYNNNRNLKHDSHWPIMNPASMSRNT